MQLPPYPSGGLAKVLLREALEQFPSDANAEDGAANRQSGSDRRGQHVSDAGNDCRIVDCHCFFLLSLECRTNPVIQ